MARQVAPAYLVLQLIKRHPLGVYLAQHQLKHQVKHLHRLQDYFRIRPRNPPRVVFSDKLVQQHHKQLPRNLLQIVALSVLVKTKLQPLTQHHHLAACLVNQLAPQLLLTALPAVLVFLAKSLKLRPKEVLQ